MADQQQNGDSNPLTDIELERLKMYQDSFKHMTTFCSGAILLASAVTGALFPKPEFRSLLGLSIALLAVGVFAAMMGLVLVPRAIDYSATDGSTEPSAVLSRLLWISVLQAFAGVGLFAYFAMANLRPP